MKIVGCQDVLGIGGWCEVGDKGGLVTDFEGVAEHEKLELSKKVEKCRGW